MYGRNSGNLSSSAVGEVSEYRARQGKSVARRDPRSGFTRLPPPALVPPSRSAAYVAPITKGGNYQGVEQGNLCADERVWRNVGKFEWFGLSRR
jgi:hypothetical protein